MVVAASLCFCLFSVTDAQALKITACGDYVAHGVVTLAADLDCSASGGLSITIDQRGEVHLAGHTLTELTVNCLGSVGDGSDAKTLKGSCSVFGPGTIGTGGITSDGRRLRVYGVTINEASHIYGTKVVIRDTNLTSSTGGCLIRTDLGFIARLRMRRAILQGCRVDAESVVIINKSQILDSNGIGVNSDACKLRIRKSTVSGHGLGGVRGQDVVVTDSVITDNGGIGVQGIGPNCTLSLRPRSNLRIDNSDISRNVIGVFTNADKTFGSSKKVRPEITMTAVRDNDLRGLDAPLAGARVRGESMVLGNGTLPSCGVSEVCGDLITGEVPTVADRSQCETSNTGVCSLD